MRRLGLISRGVNHQVRCAPQSQGDPPSGEVPRPPAQHACSSGSQHLAQEALLRLPAHSAYSCGSWGLAQPLPLRPPGSSACSCGSHQVRCLGRLASVHAHVAAGTWLRKHFCGCLPRVHAHVADSSWPSCFSCPECTLTCSCLVAADCSDCIPTRKPQAGPDRALAATCLKCMPM